MGLTIHYRFASPATNYQEAKAQVAALREAALKAGFLEVGPIIHRKGKACDPDACPEEERWLMIQAQEHRDISASGGTMRSVSVPAKEVVAFSTWPGEGCESANFGLCRYPAHIHLPDSLAGSQKRRTGLTGWRWGSFCKTQYANNPRYGGVANFLRCHVGVCRVLDRAKELGILHKVYDEGDYWEKRDLESLAREVARWDEFVAACVGQLKDQLAADMPLGLAAPILERPDFEHLEARGVDKLRN